MISTSPVATMTTPSAVPSRPRDDSRSSIQPTGVFTHSLNGLFHSDPEAPTSRSVSQPAALESTPVSNSIGRRMATANTLKKSCTVAVAKARRNSSERRALPRETSVFVTVVPMLAPMIIGTAMSMSIAPAATSPTITDVDADEDWTSTVPRMPMHNPAIGLETLENSCSWVSWPMTLMPCSSDDTPTRNT